MNIMNYKKTVIEYETLQVELSARSYQDLLLSAGISLSIDPTAFIVLYTTKLKDFKINENLYKTLVSQLSTINLKLVRKQNDRSGFNMILQNYTENSLQMSESLQSIYKLFITTGCSSIKSLSITSNLLFPNSKNLLIILPFLVSIESLDSSLSKLSKYSINFLKSEGLGERCNSLEERLKMFELERLENKNLDVFSLLNICQSLNKLQCLDLSFASDQNFTDSLYYLRLHSIKNLNLSGCKLSFSNLFKICADYQCLETFELNYCYLEFADFKTFHELTMFGKFNKLKQLSLRGTNHSCAELLAEAIQNIGGLEKLDISNNGIFDEKFKAFAFSLVVCTNLTHLYISSVNLNATIDTFVSLFVYNKLIHLDISKNNLSDSSVAAILQKTENLVLFDASGNNLSSTVMNFVPITVKYLYIGVINFIRDIKCTDIIELGIEFSDYISATDLLKSLEKYQNIKILALNKLIISNENFLLFSKTIQQMKNLEILDFREVYCNYFFMRKLNELLIKNQKLRIIGYSHGMLSDEKLYSLYKINSRNKFFRHSNQFAVFAESDLLPHKPVCELCHRYCYYPDICEWTRKKIFYISRLRNIRKIQ